MTAVLQSFCFGVNISATVYSQMLFTRTDNIEITVDIFKLILLYEDSYFVSQNPIVIKLVLQKKKLRNFTLFFILHIAFVQISKSIMILQVTQIFTVLA